MTRVYARFRYRNVMLWNARAAQLALPISLQESAPPVKATEDGVFLW